MKRATKKISPKVYAPLVVGMIVGLIFYIVGDPDTGRVVLLTVLAAAGLGYAAPPGKSKSGQP